MDHPHGCEAAREFVGRKTDELQQCSYTSSDAGSCVKGLATVRLRALVIAVRALDICGQATKGAWGMSWRQKTMTGVEDCEKLGVAVKQALIPRFPNRLALNP
jgi:hypothetical protein